MRLRIKAGQNNTTITPDNEDQSVRELVESVIVENAGWGVTSFSAVKTGFPPKSIDLSLLVKEALKNGDQLLIETGGTTTSSINKAPESAGLGSNSTPPSIPSVQLDRGYLVLRNIPDDNACMFNAILYACGSTSLPGELRRVVSSKIRSDPVTYNEIILGRPVDKYAEWIEKKDSWGGAIELGILSDWLRVKINCFDVELGLLIAFQNEQASPPEKFICLIYSGIHYDVVVTTSELSTNRSHDTGIWNMKDHDRINTACEKLCRCLQTQNYTTNTTQFRVRCLECYLILVGETGASRHANDTGHLRFGEVK